MTFSIDPGYDAEVQEMEEFTIQSQIRPLNLEFIGNVPKVAELLVLVGSKELFQFNKLKLIGRITSQDKLDLGGIYEILDQIVCIVDSVNFREMQMLPDLLYNNFEKLVIVEIQTGSPNDESLPSYFSTSSKLDSVYSTIGGISASLLSFVNLELNRQISTARIAIYML